MTGQGQTSRTLTNDEMRKIVASSSAELKADGKSVLVIVPDHTRTCPLPEMARALHQNLAPKTTKLDFLIALGTHPPMPTEHIERHFGVEPGQWEKVFGKSKASNHEWQNRQSLVHVGTLKSDEIDRISEGLFRMDVDVTVNRLVFDYDIVLICGPVFPHEVMGFSGGNKYFFPGICGEEMLNFFHLARSGHYKPENHRNKADPRPRRR